jgi:hypothetical protein
MNKTEIINALEDMMYISNVSENQYFLSKMSAILDSLKDMWDCEDFHYQEIIKAIQYEDNI